MARFRASCWLAVMQMYTTLGCPCSVPNRSGVLNSRAVDAALLLLQCRPHFAEELVPMPHPAPPASDDPLPTWQHGYICHMLQLVTSTHLGRTQRITNAEGQKSLGVTVDKFIREEIELVRTCLQNEQPETDKDGCVWSKWKVRTSQENLEENG